MSLSTREKILSVTAKIIATEGVDAASIRHVCEKAGVKAPTVYYYFTDKDGLMDAVINSAYEKYIKIHFDHVDNETPVKGLNKAWDIFFRFVEDNTELYHAIVIAHLRQRIPQKGFELFMSITEIFKKLEDKKKLKLPYMTSARIFYATSYGLALVYVSQNKNPNIKDHIRLMRDLCIEGLLV
jgi:AcrR family transcriptional regulator